MSINGDDWGLVPNGGVNLYDYIDGDGDLLSVDVFDGVWLAVSIYKHGRTALLTVLINDPGEARKISAQLDSWADEQERGA